MISHEIHAFQTVDEAADRRAHAGLVIKRYAAAI